MSDTKYPIHWSDARKAFASGDMCTCDVGRSKGPCRFCLMLTDIEANHFYSALVAGWKTPVADAMNRLLSLWDSQDAAHNNRTSEHILDDAKEREWNNNGRRMGVFNRNIVPPRRHQPTTYCCDSILTAFDATQQQTMDHLSGTRAAFRDDDAKIESPLALDGPGRKARSAETSDNRRVDPPIAKSIGAQHEELQAKTNLANETTDCKKDHFFVGLDVAKQEKSLGRKLFDEQFKVMGMNDVDLDRQWHAYTPSQRLTYENRAIDSANGSRKVFPDREWMSVQKWAQNAFVIKR